MSARRLLSPFAPVRIAALLSVVPFSASCANSSPRHVERQELIAAWGSRPAPTIVVDLDDTLLDSGVLSGIELAVGIGYLSRAPFPGAVRVLRGHVDRGGHVVYLTARDDWFAARSRRWLDVAGFPPGPLITSTRWLPTARGQFEYKRGAIEWVRGLGVEPGLGVGDRPSDILAYLASGCDAILLVEGEADPDFEEANGVRPLAAGDTLRPLTSRVEAVIFDPERYWDVVGRRLEARVATAE